MTESHRDRTDRCPGVFTTHAAADGALARIRLPGGSITAAQLEALAEGAAGFGDGFLEITARGNLQIRGIADTDGLGALIVDAGLAPTSTHDRARNIEVSSLTGRIGGLADLRQVVTALDDLLRADEVFAGLSGRFLFGLDDGRGDVLARNPDVTAIARSAMVADVLLGELTLGSTPIDGLATAMASIARDMVQVAPTAWRVGDLTGVEHEAIVTAARGRLDTAIGEPETPPASAPSPIVGWFDQDDRAVLLGGVVELARLPARLAQFLAAVGKPIIFTPEREILLCDLDEAVAETVVRVLAPMGLIFDASSPWASVSCCVGAPGCGRAHAAVREDLLVRVEQGPVDEREHWSGCERGCGAPTEAHLRVEATPDGYRRTRTDA
ncbi:precorrin-3B synthase [Gordonia amarae]|uniref:Precorrin-3B synthase n=2 Tax=Gordonia amarae TaxID=36821 RepID=G7GJK9_9ACTN|nr:precorrin-3B synthase [Gordonia amarae]MCS3879044.1 precorrin-3B synthase [Gordonia amarae]QHN17583.1 precorrin-3B synthase [Gordonia amarae]QHN22109.1 precorrin-3B synthase [Gordonia amarae]QHN39736.1 precorrin-3B synthase [Gordonia amarae]GAB03784.1 precorrin-3B synthase [Gordonia amarae NBRC 15530]